MQERRIAQLTFVPFVVLAVMIAVRVCADGVVVPGDTQSLLNGVGGLDFCLHAGVTPCSITEKWPLLQYIPALAVKRLGGSRTDATNVLVLLNALGVVATIALVCLAARRFSGRVGARLALLACLLTPLPFYAEASYNEPLAMFFVTLMVVGLLSRWHPAVAAVGLVGAGLSKETMLPFLLAFAVLAIYAPVARERRRASLVAVAVAASVVVAATVGFNLFRYGVAYNKDYTSANFVVPGLWWKADYLAAHIFAPDAGLVFYWPAAVALVIAVVWAMPRHRYRWMAAVLAVLLLLLATLASWWAPFGWIAWGTRFVVPWVPALLVFALAALGSAGTARLRMLLHHRVGAAIAALLVTALAVPQIGAFLDPVGSITAPAPRKSACTQNSSHAEDLVRAGSRAARVANERCTSDRAWNGYSWRHAWDEAGGTHLLWTFVFALAALALAAGAAWEARVGDPAPV